MSLTQILSLRRHIPPSIDDHCLVQIVDYLDDTNSAIGRVVGCMLKGDTDRRSPKRQGPKGEQKQSYYQGEGEPFPFGQPGEHRAFRVIG